MNSILWTTLFAVLMAGAIVVMLRVLVGLVTDSATWTGRESRVWLARLCPFCPVAVKQRTRRCNS
jgi:hypothetical protein